MTLRLRQICLVAPGIDAAVDTLRGLFGLGPCHRGSIDAYGLFNALFVFGHQFLEIVAPQSGRLDATTKAGRYALRSGGRGGYMAIFDGFDPERRRAHVESLGIRIAWDMDYPGFRGIQLDPRDCRATMLEIDRTDGNADLDGAYWPAGPDWRAGQRLDLADGIPWIEVETPDPDGLASHWGRILETSVAQAQGVPVLRFELGSVRFAQAPAGTPERMCRLDVSVADPAGVRERARSLGLPARGDGFDLYGVTMVPVPLAGAR